MDNFATIIKLLDKYCPIYDDVVHFTNVNSFNELCKIFYIKMDDITNWIYSHYPNKTYSIKWDDGEQSWYQNGKLHRDGDKPALISLDGIQSWYKNGKLHRDNDLPASVWPSGRQSWYQNGLLHRDNGPAVITPYGEQQWHENGKFIKIKYV